MMKTWFNIKNQAGQAEISIFDEIGIWGVDATMFKKELDGIKDSSSIKLLLNSPGGSVFDGIAIYNMLKDYRDKLTVEVTGFAASIASVIAMAGKEIIMREGSLMMIHKPWTMALGESDDLRKTADLLDQIEDQLIGIYSKKTDLSDTTIKQMLKEETWMSGDQAVEYGFATSTDEAPAIAAKWSGELKANKTPEGVVIEKIEQPEKEVLKVVENKIIKDHFTSEEIEDTAVSENIALSNKKFSEFKFKQFENLAQ